MSTNRSTALPTPYVPPRLLDDHPSLPDGRALAGARRPLTPEEHSANARFAAALLGTRNHDDAALLVSDDLQRDPRTAPERAEDLLRQLAERDPETAASFRESMQRVATARSSDGGSPEPSETASTQTPRPADRKREIGHILFPGQVSSEKENFWQELFLDLMPGIGNWRSISHGAADAREVKEALQRSDYEVAFLYSLLTGLDVVGAVPFAGSATNVARPFIRQAIRATPGVRRVHASWVLAQAKRRFEQRLPSTKPEELYGKVWGRLPKSRQRLLLAIRPHVIGGAGENYTDELLGSAGFASTGRSLAFGDRRYDADTAEKLETIFFSFFAVPREAAQRTLYEVKTAGGKYTPHQRKADARNREEPTVEDIQLLRLKLSQVPFEFLTTQTKRLLEGGAKSGKVRFADEEIGELVRSMREARLMDGSALTAFDWLSTVARVSAEIGREIAGEREQE